MLSKWKRWGYTLCLSLFFTSLFNQPYVTAKVFTPVANTGAGVEPSIAAKEPSTPQLEHPAHPVDQNAFNVNDFTGRYEAVEVIATGYYAGKESTGKEPGHPQYGITYSGVTVQRDQFSISTIAADINVFPIGTILYIPGYGYGIVADTGSAIKGNKIDLYFQTKQAVYEQWGKKKLHVYVIERGQGKLPPELMERITHTYKQLHTRS